jgi:hypothetical protein
MVNMGSNPGRHCLGGLIVGGALLGLVGQSVIPAHAASTPTWVSTKGKVVSLSLIADYNNQNMGFNFDGAAHGKMIVTVPLGDTIDVTFQNKAKGVPHNVQFITFTTNVPGGALAQPAFKGAETPQRRFPVGGRGTGNGGSSSAGGNGGGGFGAPGAQKPEIFSFVANKSGKYMFMRAIAGHALAGMWDTFVVSRSATTATATF